MIPCSPQNPFVPEPSKQARRGRKLLAPPSKLSSKQQLKHKEASSSARFAFSSKGEAMLAQSAASRWALAEHCRPADVASGSSAFVGDASFRPALATGTQKLFAPARPSPYRASASSAKAMSTVSEVEPRPQTGASPTAGSEFVREHLRKLKAYTPIEPFEVLSERMGRKPQDIVKLDANENPYGPPPEVLEALSSMSYPHIYPDPECRRLRQALAEDTGVSAEHLIVGCGADELIDLLMRCTLDPGDSIVDCPPTFTMYAFDADVNGAQVIKVPRNPGDFSIDMAAIREAVARHDPRIIFLTSPNNPDGSVLPDSELREVLSLAPQRLLVVLDEAYIEFAGQPSRMPWVQEHPNLVVLRTFSKRAALAGIRVGYGAFPLGLAEYLWRAKQPYNVSVAAETAACAALSNPQYLENVRDALVSERERLMERLESDALPFLKPYPSHANFILCSVLSPWDALTVKNSLADHGIMVRHYAKPELKNFIRISVGKPEHTDALMAALDAIQKERR